MRAFQRFSAGAALVVGSGCASPPGESGDPSGRVGPADGLHLNGLHLNGLHLNGLHLNGLYLNGMQIDGSHLNGMRLHDLVIDDSHMNIVTLAGGQIVAIGDGGIALGGAAIAGATLAATLESGAQITLRIDGVASSGAPDLLRYAISHALPGGAAFEPICGTENGAPVLAIPLSGGWDESEGTPTGGARIDDPTRVTFACEGYALAKCVELGYAPWRRVTECRANGDCRVMALSPFHHACTRMLRADYCGDGVSATREGTLVDVWDAIGLQSDDAPSWPFEAEWTRSGASCVSRTRWPTMPGEGMSVESYIQQHCPSRWQPSGCGSAGSTFFVENGFALPPKVRVLLRTRVAGAM